MQCRNTEPSDTSANNNTEDTVHTTPEYRRPVKVLSRRVYDAINRETDISSRQNDMSMPSAFCHDLCSVRSIQFLLCMYGFATLASSSYEWKEIENAVDRGVSSVEAVDVKDLWLLAAGRH